MFFDSFDLSYQCYGTFTMYVGDLSHPPATFRIGSEWHLHTGCGRPQAQLPGYSTASLQFSRGDFIYSLAPRQQRLKDPGKLCWKNLELPYDQVFNWEFSGPWDGFGGVLGDQ